MIATSRDAEAIWCPFGRRAVGDEGVGTAAVNRGPSGQFNRADVAISLSPCLGSQCMAWRWLSNGEAARAGYCGLAGQVQVGP